MPATVYLRAAGNGLSETDSEPLNLRLVFKGRLDVEPVHSSNMRKNKTNPIDYLYFYGGLLIKVNTFVISV